MSRLKMNIPRDVDGEPIFEPGTTKHRMPKVRRPDVFGEAHDPKGTFLGEWNVTSAYRRMKNGMKLLAYEDESTDHWQWYVSDPKDKRIVILAGSSRNLDDAYDHAEQAWANKIEKAKRLQKDRIRRAERKAGLSARKTKAKR